MHVSGTTRAQLRGRSLRKTMSKPERLLWWAIRGEQLGVRFRRSPAAGPYILDFYCVSENLCVEVDGSSHDFRNAHDEQRDRFLHGIGVRVLRLPAREILSNLSGSVAKIRALITPSDLPAAGHLPRVPGGEAN